MTASASEPRATTPPRIGLPRAAGVGFKSAHFDAIMQDADAPAFFEIHAENYMGDGGSAHARLAALRERFALSFHGVGLSIGAMAGLDREHLKRLRILCDRYAPESFSEHLAWSSHGLNFFNDLLPLPYNEETLARVCAHIDQTQDALGRAMLLENPATYLQFAATTMPETEFLAEIVRRTGCGLLLDINNVFVACTNHCADPDAYLDAFPLAHVREIHLAGHDIAEGEGEPLLIDAHGSPIADPVWALYARTLARTGPMPTLVEWDNDVPDWPVLSAQARQAETFLAHQRAKAA